MMPRQIGFIALFILATSSLRAQDERKTATIKLGEEFEYMGVRLEYKFSDPAPTPLGYGTASIWVHGPSGKLGPMTIPLSVESSSPTDSVLAYIDDVALTLRPIYRKERPALHVFSHLKVDAISSPNTGTLSAAPESNTGFYVSSAAPISINGWKISHTEDRVAFPDGSDHHELVVENESTGERLKVPVYKGSKRTFGRFRLSVLYVYPSFKTVYISIAATKADPWVRGRDAWVEEFEWPVEEETLGDTLDRLGHEAGFEVEWTEFPGHPESIDYWKETGPYSGSETSDFLAHDFVYQVVDFPNRARHHVDSEHRRTYDLAYEWTDPTHLRVWTEGWEKKVEEDEKQRRREIEEDEKQKRREAELENFKAEFEQGDFSLQTRIYALKTITPITAKALVDRELSDFNLVSKTHSREGRFAKLIRNGESYEIIAIKTGYPGVIYKVALSGAAEEAIADEKANALIVKAIPATHKTIAALLARMDGLLDAERPRAAPDHFGLEVILLKGGEREPERRPERERFQVSSIAMGTIDAIQVSQGSRVRRGEPLVQMKLAVGPALAATKQILQLTRGQLGDTKKMYEAGRITMSEVHEAMIKVVELEEKIAQQQAELDSAALLRAPRAGVVEKILIKVGETVEENMPVVTLIADPGERVEVRFEVEGSLKHLNLKPGDWVESGDLVGALDSASLVRQIDLNKAALAQMEEKNAQMRIKIGVYGSGPDIEAVNPEAKARFEEARQLLIGEVARMETLRGMIRELQEKKKASVLKAPASGQVESIADFEVGDLITPEDLILTIVPGEPSTGQANARIEPGELLDRYGLTLEDLEPLGVSHVFELARAVVTITAAPDDPMGKSSLWLSSIYLDQPYALNLEYIDNREPYVILRGSLVPSPFQTRSENYQPLIENTFYLEPDKPSIVGISNLREALILILRLK